MIGYSERYMTRSEIRRAKREARFVRVLQLAGACVLIALTANALGILINSTTWFERLLLVMLPMVAANSTRKGSDE